MQEQNPFVNIIYQSRLLYKSQFQPIKSSIEDQQTTLKLKLITQLPNTIQLHKQHLNQQTTTNNKQLINNEQITTKTINKQPIIQGSKNQTNSIGSLIKSILNPTDSSNTKIKTFEKYQKNIQEVSSIANSLALSQRMEMNLSQSTKLGTIKSQSLRKLIRPTWHPPFKLYRVIVGHQGWVRCIAVSPCNNFFATGSADRTIKFWDLASGELKITLTGHINTVRGMEFSKYHPYLFSCGEDKSVKCWDLQMNKVIRNYHGHLSGVYCLKIHDGLSVLATGGRDSAARIWDIRVRKQIHCLSGHAHTVGSIITQESEPHIITGSYDSFVKLWDLGSGRCIKTLTNHKKSIRTMVEHPKQYTFATAASDNIKVWKNPDGEFLRNISGHNSIIDSMAINADGVLVTGGNDGSMKFWDWKSGYNFQQLQIQPQPGSIQAESGIFALNFDRSGSRLLSGECDKTIKMWKQDQTATEETHPIKSFKMEFEQKRFN